MIPMDYAIATIFVMVVVGLFSVIVTEIGNAYSRHLEKENQNNKG